MHMIASYAKSNSGDGEARKWMNRHQLAEYLGVSDRTVSNWIAKRRIPFSKINGVLRFDREAVDRHLNDVATRPFRVE